MSTGVFLAEIDFITKQMKDHCEDKMTSPFSAEPSVREKIDRQGKMLEAKCKVLTEERNRRGQ